jgi:hypothetical protein
MEKKMERKMQPRLTRIEDLSVVGSELPELAEEQLRLVEGGCKPWTKMIVIGGPAYYGPMY